MLGNIWLPSVLIVTAIFSAGAMYKSYSDIQEAKQIQENYEIISNIKTLLAKQYNKNPQDITRDEIIANLPSGGNWEKVLLLDRNKDSNLLNKELVDEKGNFEISEDEKLKLLALKAKLKNITDISSITADSTTKKYTFEVGKIEKNAVLNDIEIEKSLTRAVNALGVEILYSGVTSPSSSFLDTILTKILEEFTPYDSMYQEFRTASEISVNTILDTSETLKRKKDYFKSKIKEKLEKNETAIESRLYLLLKDK
jgi:type II secretory pathway pseudopilin PulG